MVLAIFLCAVVACAGPIHVAKTENEGIKTVYQDPELSDLSQKYQPVLKDIYQRYQTTGVDIYPNGIGFTSVLDQDGKKRHYLLVQVRPRNIMFGEVQTTPHDRFVEVYKRHFEKNLRLMKPGDLGDEVEGLAFGVYWPVRDLSQCDTYGGFLEYTIIYFPKMDFIDLAARNITFSEAVENAEIVTSLSRKPAIPVKITETD
jgi:hypothetical protein